MPKGNNFFEDFMKMSGSVMDAAFNSAHDMRSQFEQNVDLKIEQILQKHNLVTREEFDAVKTMAEKARKENESLKKKFTALEKKVKK